MKWTVLKTDGDFRSTEYERQRLASIGAELIEIDAKSSEDILNSGISPDALLVLACPISEALMKALPKVKIISRYGIGVDMVDVKAATALGIPVTNVPDYCVDEVSSHAIGLMLSVIRQIPLFNHVVRTGLWNTVEMARPIERIEGSTIGLVGFGRLGRAVATKLENWGARLIAYDPFVPDTAFRELHVENIGSINHLLEQADVVSLHLNLSPETYHLIGQEQFAKMKRHAILINTSRGALVDEIALAKALSEHRIGGAGLDVLEHEPPDTDNPIFQCERVVLTPHVSYYSETSVQLVQQAAAQALLEILSGTKPRNLINPQVWDRRRV